MGVKVVEEDMVRFIQQLEGRVAAEVHIRHWNKAALGPGPKLDHGLGDPPKSQCCSNNPLSPLSL